MTPGPLWLASGDVNHSNMNKSRLITLLQAGCAVGLLVLFVLPDQIGFPQRLIAVTFLAALILLQFARVRTADVVVQDDDEEPAGLRKLFDEADVVGRSILDGVPDPAIVVDANFGVAVVNKAARKALEMEEGQNVPCFRAIHGLDAPCDESGRPCVIKTGQSGKTIQTRLGDDGEERLVELRATPLFDDAGDVMGAIEVLHDLNEQEKLALRLQRAKEDAATAHKARADFVATMSHEVRTPMNAVLGMADLLRLTALTRKQKSYVQIMESSSNMLLSLVDNMIDFSTLESGQLELKKEPFHVADLLERVLEIMGYQAYSKGLELAGMTEHDSDVQVIGDYERLRQIMINLVSNAIKFTSAGEVIVKLTIDTPDDGESKLTVSVMDSGVGMSKEKAAQLFTPFGSAPDRSRSQEQGSGLGLAISRQLVDLMGGDIGVDSDIGQGTSAWFAVPIELAADMRASVRQDRGALNNRHLLIINDSPKVAESFCSSLEAWDIACEVETQPDRVASRLVAAMESGYPFDCVVIDAEAQKEDRLSLAQAIRKDSDLPIVLLTSIVRPLNVGEISSIGKVRCVNKPVLPSELRHNLFSLLRVDVLDPSRMDANLPASLRVLIAEDNPINRKVLRSMLSSLNLAADTVNDGPSVLAALKESSYDLILMDCQMPGMDGDEVTRIIREGRASRSGQPVVVAITADVSAGHREECLHAGMDDFLAKPVRLDTLKAGLRRWAYMSDSRRVQVHHSTRAASPASGEIIERLHDRAGVDSDELIGEFIDLFLDDTTSRLEILQVALEEHDLETLRRECHALKGACLELGVADLGTCCDDLGKASREKRVNDLPGALHRLTAEFERVRPIFEAEKSRPG